MDVPCVEQCMIIRNTELAASQEKFDEFEKRYKEVQANCSPDALFRKLQGMKKFMFGHSFSLICICSAMDQSNSWLLYIRCCKRGWWRVWELSPKVFKWRDWATWIHPEVPKAAPPLPQAITHSHGSTYITDHPRLVTIKISHLCTGFRT